MRPQENISFKYGHTHRQTHERLERSENLLGIYQVGDRNIDSSSTETKCKRFFRNPRIRLDKHLDKTPVTIHVEGIKRSDDIRPETEEFNAYIWSFRINNKNYFSAPANRCSAQIKLTNVNHYLDFTWRSNIPILENCHISDLTDEPPRQVYAKRLAYEYLIERFIDTNDPNIDIETRDVEPHLLNFMFTFESSEYAYFIINRKMATWYGDHDVFYSEVGGTHLLLPMGTRNFPVIVRLQWLKPGSIDQYEYSSNSGERFLINVESWDDISISKG
ncbi:MAG TPA: hypothetical protein VE130_06760 [Nitrososphaeraceae archaeon]|jgi:hypothetical protein|nr:hypothetical protein [Nitrososphaeraceae archaeon]